MDFSVTTLLLWSCRKGPRKGLSFSRHGDEGLHLLPFSKGLTILMRDWFLFDASLLFAIFGPFCSYSRVVEAYPRCPSGSFVVVKLAGGFSPLRMFTIRLLPFPLLMGQWGYEMITSLPACLCKC